MYSGSGYSDWEIGDVDVFLHDGIYHLFHLIIPNHDYIAHATSEDGINWRREKNALFVGHPGEWDDDMLWTMHVSKEDDHFVMYYTGLARKEKGKVQQVGRAISHDLIHWEKETACGLPMGSDGPHYESMQNNPRNWLSFRDPFRFDYRNETYLLMCARAAAGAVSRRGCVGLAKLTDKGFELQKPLFTPYVYDDVECPCVIEIKGRFYLIGSIREDVKVRYWTAPEFLDEYRAFHANVLLPQGNYAARIIKEGDHWMVYNFYFVGNVSTLRVLPPPKELDVDADGRLLLKSFHRWNEKILGTIYQCAFPLIHTTFGNPTASFHQDKERWDMSSKSGYEVFGFQKPAASFIWEGRLTLEGIGKCGLVVDCDHEGNGYFISLDFVHGFVQIRSWGFNPENVHSNFVFEPLQANQFELEDDRSMHFKLIRFGHYIELSIDGIVKLTLIDYRYSGKLIGLYSSSSDISLTDSVLHILSDPEEEYGSQEESVNSER